MLHGTGKIQRAEFGKACIHVYVTCRKQRAAGGRVVCERPQVLMHRGLVDLMDMHVIVQGGLVDFIPTNVYNCSRGAG